ncbi:MAG: hypothetical protein HXY40_12830 [Chloroflexi bacterium]|nr:hypothetical protein [Chloroflexota bacterium]
MAFLQLFQNAVQTSFLLRWTLANTVGWSLGLLLGLLLGAPLGQWLGTPLLALLLSGALAGLVVGTCQYWALRAIVSRRWPLYSLVGGVLGAFPALLLGFTLLLGWPLGMALMGAGFAGVLAAAQCLVPSVKPDVAFLRTHAGGWLAFNMLAGGLCGAASVLAALPILPLVCSAGPPLFGLVTGLLLVRVILPENARA